MKKKLLIGIILVTLGACSYGVLATFVKLAYQEGFTTIEVTSSQYLIGWIALAIVTLFFSQKKDENTQQTSPCTILKLVIAGTSLGFTGLFYYLSVKHIPVSIAIVLLMQSTWMGVLVESVLKKQLPSIKKSFVCITILIGTLLATGIFNTTFSLNIKGFSYGILAALSYTITIYSSAKIGLEMHSIRRSFWLATGGTLVVIIVAIIQYPPNFNIDVFYYWGIIMAVFGTFLPPILFAYGMPRTGIGLGTILGASELPISVFFASILLSEHVNKIQWGGLVIILGSILVMNIQFKKDY